MLTTKSLAQGRAVFLSGFTGLITRDVITLDIPPGTKPFILVPHLDAGQRVTDTDEPQTPIGLKINYGFITPDSEPQLLGPGVRLASKPRSISVGLLHANGGPNPQGIPLANEEKVPHRVFLQCQFSGTRSELDIPEQFGIYILFN